MTNIYFPNFGGETPPPEGPPLIEVHEREPVNGVIVPELNLEMTDSIQDKFADQFNSLVTQLSVKNETVNRIDYKAERMNPRILEVYGPAISRKTVRGGKTPSGADITNAILGYQETRRDHEVGLVGEAEDNLTELIFSSDTPVMLGILAEMTAGSDHNMDHTDREIRSANTEAEVRDSFALDTRVRLAELRREHALDPIRDDPSVAGWAMPGRVARLEKARTVADKESSVRYAKHTHAARQANQKLEKAEKVRQLAEGFPERLANVLDEAGNRYQEQVDRLDDIFDYTASRIDNWGFGSESPEADLPDQVAEGLAEWQGQLGELSRYDSYRAESLRQWVGQSVRFYQRQALLLGRDDPSLPRFSLQRGVVIDTAGREQTLHEDGSITRTENADGESDPGGSPVRRHADGRVWEREVPEVTYHDFLTNYGPGRIEELDDDELEVIAGRTVYDWEFERSTESDLTAAFAVRTHADRLVERTEQYQLYYQSLQDEVAETQRFLLAAEVARNHEIARKVREVENPDDEASQEAIRQQVDGRIDSLRTKFNGGQEQLAIHLDGLRATRARLNQAEYFRSFFAVTQPEAAQGHSRGRAQTLPRGEVAHSNKTLNGITGNWVIYPDGQAQLFDELGNPVGNYSANGERI